MELSSSVLAGLAAQAERQLDMVDKLHAALEQARGTAESDDGLIRATAGARGELLELELDPRLLRNPDSAALAADIVDTTRAAAANAQVRAASSAGEFLPDDLDPTVENFDFDIDPLKHELGRVAGGDALQPPRYGGRRHA